MVADVVFDGDTRYILRALACDNTEGMRGRGGTGVSGGEGRRTKGEVRKGEEEL